MYVTPLGKWGPGGGSLAVSLCVYFCEMVFPPLLQGKLWAFFENRGTAWFYQLKFLSGRGAGRTPPGGGQGPREGKSLGSCPGLPGP